MNNLVAKDETQIAEIYEATVYEMAINNGNFEASIATNKKLPI